MKYIIVAYDQNRVIGVRGMLPWQGKMPADMRHFREATSGQAVIMGRKTFESIGRPLPNRQNIVVTHQAITIDGVTVVGSLQEAYDVVESGRETYVIGGGQIYQQALMDVDVVLATEIKARFEGGDAFFPQLGSEWAVTDREDFAADDMNAYDYSFITYTKQR
jgi:dihydrofolate reductase